MRHLDRRRRGRRHHLTGPGSEQALTGREVKQRVGDQRKTDKAEDGRHQEGARTIQPLFDPLKQRPAAHAKDRDSE